MQYYIELQSTYLQPFDPFTPFKTPGDKAVLKRFMGGDRLVNWNYTCPVNWFLETPSGRNQTLLAGKDIDREDTTYSYGIVRALLKIGTSAGTSDGWIASSWLHRDGGNPGREWFLYDAQKAKEAQKRWEEFQVIKAQWDAVEVPYAFDAIRLSFKALAVLRYMKRHRCDIAPFAELQDALKELRLQGLLVLREDGLMVLTDEGYRTRVPKGPIANVVRNPNPRQRTALAQQQAAEVYTV